MSELLKTEKTEWSGTVKGIRAIVVKWKPEYSKEPKWNYYVIIHKNNLGEDFAKFDIEPKKMDLIKERWSYSYYHLEDYFNFHGGITFYEKLRNENGEVWGVKIGCDYAHYGDDEFFHDYGFVYGDLKTTIDCFIDHFPNYKIWCSGNGKFYGLEDGKFNDKGAFYSNEWINKIEIEKAKGGLQ